MAKNEQMSGEDEEPLIVRLGEKGDDPITANLRRIYDEAAQEPLPDHLLQLLDKLAEAERRR